MSVETWDRACVYLTETYCECFASRQISCFWSSDVNFGCYCLDSPSSLLMSCPCCIYLNKLVYSKDVFILTMFSASSHPPIIKFWMCLQSFNQVFGSCMALGIPPSHLSGWPAVLLLSVAHLTLIWMNQYGYFPLTQLMTDLHLQKPRWCLIRHMFNTIEQKYESVESQLCWLGVNDVCRFLALFVPMQQPEKIRLKG